MTDMIKQKRFRTGPETGTTWKRALKRDWELYLMLSIPLFLTILFKYGAYPGLRIAFMNYLPAKGFEGSEWVGFETFRKVFRDRDFLLALRNSLIFNFAEVIISFPMPIILALILNELKYPRFKKVSQTILYLPHFLSWAIIGSLTYTLFRTETGLVNNILLSAGLISKRIPFLTENLNWSITYLLVGVWAGMGWGSIIYLAAISSINEELYEAAMIDGAGRWKRMWYITLPGIKPTVITLLIMTLGRLMGSSYERLSAMGNVNVKAVSYQLAIYIYEKGLASGTGFSKAAAVGLFQSFVGLLLVLASDRFAKALGEDGLL
ncbi:polysaccharide ABC transporter ATP-binding protein [Thermoclostridium stercorarium subsp. thermolacticum DSM 2910]|jgi:putative aldouronate transport system permease protein|nr:ABC transporter periplasmic subunit-1 [Thermoclostridium stercorarium subsp. stercorarium DSM 8532]ANW99898.1 polysaccharide ABC transporter ATP-binding protein [Thermoclostridium stercorarium subsp. thermolacticum DSM 2910]ANX02523.1 polysaccharide ABC transporter ATP-binding protein [Thermoclostridium stercorarium subsp. leptospartum DSM 9219]